MNADQCAAGRRTTTSAMACIARPSREAASPMSPIRWAAAVRFRPGIQGFVTSFPQPIADDKVRGKPEKFADHYTQATLFWNSQSPIEKGAHHPRLSLRADQGDRCRRFASAYCR
jgi:hypothetical protein